MNKVQYGGQATENGKFTVDFDMENPQDILLIVDYVPVKGEIIWYLSLTTWLISLSIMLSSSIHAVVNIIKKRKKQTKYNQRH